jgi:hypothetical protein
LLRYSEPMNSRTTIAIRLIPASLFLGLLLLRSAR